MKTLVELTRNYPAPFLQTLRDGRGRAAVQRFIEIYSRPSLTWEDLGFLRERTELPILLKGILHPQDATRAIEAGIDGIVVSNHGGRQVDGSISTLEALPRSSRPSTGGSRSCSTRGFEAAPTRSRRSPWAPPRS